MTTTTTRPEARTDAPGAGSPGSAEKKAGLMATVLGFVLGGPVGGIVMAMAVGLEQAFGKAGWQQPRWLGGERPAALTPEQLRERHDQAVAEARQWVRDARQRAKAHDETWAAHRARVRDWVAAGRTGPKPERPKRRGLGETVGNAIAASKSWYTLFDDRMAKGNEHVNTAYDKIGNAARGIWRFGTGFAEGAKRGWDDYRDSKRPAEQDRVGDAPVDPQWFPFGEQPEAADEAIPAQADPAQEQVTEAEPVTEDLPSDPEPITGAEPEGAPRTPIWVGTATVGEPVGALTSGPAGPAGTTQGDNMTDNDAAVATATGTGLAPRGPQGETNLDLLLQAFRPIGPLLANTETLTDDLDTERGEILMRVATIAALTAAKGAPLLVVHIMQEALATAAAISRGVTGIAVQNTMAQDLVIQGLQALDPARKGLADLHAEQASGDVLDRVGS